MGKELYELLKAISQNSMLHIKGVAYRPIAKVIYAAQSSPGKIYAKIFFDNHKVLVICPDDDYLCFGQDLGDIGTDFPGKPSIVYQEHTYHLTASDYKIVINFEFGDPALTEGEVKYWEYEAEDDPTQVLSLGIVQRTRVRADVVAELLSLGDLKIG